MPDEESQPLDDNNNIESNDVASDGNKPQPPASQEPSGTARVITPEGLIMFTLAVGLDGAGLGLIALDAAFGIGLAFGPVISLFGYGVMGIWQMSRGMGSDKGGKLLNDNLMRFIKKQGWKIGLEAIPLVDALPMFTSIVYSELKNSNN